MENHYTVHVKVTRIIERKEDQYGKVTQERVVQDITEFTVRDTTVEQVVERAVITLNASAV